MGPRPALPAYFRLERGRGHLPELDGLRGIAVLLVFLRHTVRPFWNEDHEFVPIGGWDLGVPLSNGWVGVDLFFVLSGFLITHHVLRLRDKAAGGDWRWGPYMAKRVLRIVPAYYAVLALAVLGAFPGHPIPEQGLGLSVAYHLVFLQDYLPSNLIVAFWSLGVEEKFYLVAPLLIPAVAAQPTLGRRWLGLTTVLGLGLAARVVTAVQRPDVVEYAAFFPVFRSPFHMTLDPILIGVGLAFTYRARAELSWLDRSMADRVFWAGAALIGALLLPTGLMDQITWWDKTLQPTAIALGFGAIALGLLLGGGPARFFRAWWLFFFGKISYSLYLVHMALVPLSLGLVAGLEGGPAHLPAFALVFLAVSVAVSLVVHFAVEKPFLILKDRLT